jgi:iron complex outermembrane receptor protein
MHSPVKTAACNGSSRLRTNKKLLAATIAAMLSAPLPTLAQQAGAIDDPQMMEEVIVTGSFIRRSEGFTAASPITQMSAEDLQAEGTVNMAQVVQNLTFNAGTGITSGIQGVTDQTAGFNLRGLGRRATLQLMDGKRVASDNVQLLLPGIAIQRIDIVTDGAAALYGTDAVAGVVNIIPYTSYDGVTMELYEERDTRGDFHDRELSAIWGGELSNNINAVAAISHRDQGDLRWHDRPKHMNAGLTHNTGSHPGNFIAPVRDENGFLTGEMAGRPDPTCGIIQEEPAQVDANPYGMLFGGRCWLDFGSTRSFRNPQTISQYYGNVDYDVSADLNISAQINYSRQIRKSRANQANPGGRVDEMPVVRGELPGNTFRALSADGRELFAQPARDDAGNIVTDGYGRPLPLRGPDGHVMLAGNQFAAMDADPMGGVPFYEDVFLEAWMPFGKTNTIPNGFNKDRTHRERYDYRNYRFTLTADFSVPFLSDWDGTAYYINANDINRSVGSQRFSFSAIEQGLNCDVINEVDHCFNPFGLVEDRFATPQHVADAIWPITRMNNQIKLQTFDVILNGAINPGGFELPGGAIGAAFGYQRRMEKVDLVPPALNISGDQFIGTQEFPSTNSRFVNAGFVELALPLLSNLELGMAVRNENFSSGQDSTIGKFGVVYEPVDWLGLRATYGQAFIAPTLNQLFASESCGLTQVDDQFTTFSGWIASCSSGNPNLESETSDSISLGIDLLPTDNLRMSLTWSETDFMDRIVSTTTQDIIRTDFFNFQQATGFTPTDAQPYPSVDMLQAWVNDSRSDPRIVRDPRNIENVQLIQQSDSNASTMLVRAWDMTMDYSRPFRDWGTFRLGLQGTYMETYNFQLSPIDPSREAVGKQNNSYGAVPAIPRIRANARLGWSRDQHSAAATVRYVHAVDFDANQFAFQQFFPINNWRHTDEIRAWTSVDALYTYRDIEMFGGSLSLTGGVRNVFDREAQKTGMIAGVVTELQDVLGRVVYARLNYEF